MRWLRGCRKCDGRGLTLRFSGRGPLVVGRGWRILRFGSRKWSSQSSPRACAVRHGAGKARSLGFLGSPGADSKLTDEGGAALPASSCGLGLSSFLSPSRGAARDGQCQRQGDRFSFCVLHKQRQEPWASWRDAHPLWVLVSPLEGVFTPERFRSAHGFELFFFSLCLTSHEPGSTFILIFFLNF